MKVVRSKLVEILEALNVHGVRGWTPENLEKQVNKEGGISRFRSPPDLPLANKTQDKVWEGIVAAQTAGEQIEVEDDLVETKTESSQPEKKSKTKPAAKKKSMKAAKKTPKTKSDKKTLKKSSQAISTNKKLTWAQKVAAWQKNPYPLTGKGAGVVKCIVDELKAAGKARKPVSKAFLLGVLTQKFPEKDPKRMLKTLNNQVPTQLRQYRCIHVWKKASYDEKTKTRTTLYWISGEGKNPQPETKGK